MVRLLRKESFLFLPSIPLRRARCIVNAKREGASGVHHRTTTFSIYERDGRRIFGINLNPPGLEPSTQLIDGPLEAKADVALDSATQLEDGVVGEQRQLDAC
ncbi:hypothetical protein EVAR_98012_1 [Eumeta japonica]|uniref:Uncharacterized protein n=1 Tax=Eumeta variegata TaxID=151549 RepID=A0A4C1WIF6_EUMVA|nr:hypothetical protein EVAR_98012_1 [Eumeta japonica]